MLLSWSRVAIRERSSCTAVRKRRVSAFALSHWLVRALLSQLNLSAQTKRSSSHFDFDFDGREGNAHTHTSTAHKLGVDGSGRRKRQEIKKTTSGFDAPASATRPHLPDLHSHLTPLALIRSQQQQHEYHRASSTGSILTGDPIGERARCRHRHVKMREIEKQKDREIG